MYLYIFFATVSQLLKYICISGLLTGKEKYTKADGDKDRKQDREIREGSVDLVIQMSYCVLFNNTNKLGEFASKTLI